MTRFKISPAHDKPVDEAILLGHDEIVKALKNFIESDDMITPLSIAIDGDWGSGKTSIVNTLAKQLPSEQFIKVFFEPWRYENSDPPLALVSTILNEINKVSVTEISSNIINLAANTFSSKYLNKDIKDVAGFILGKVKTVESFSESLEKCLKEGRKNNEKLIIMIDDLDRCDVENTLLILSIMKLFLEIDDCICIAAVDFERLKQAWRTKYKVNEVDDKGKEYLEKIFQIKVAVPKPSNDQVKEYLDDLVPGMDEILLRLFSIVGPKNPRAIKKMLNIIRFRASMLNSDFSNDASALWTLLEYILENKNLILAYNGLGKTGNSFGQLINNVTPDEEENYRNTICNHIPRANSIPNVFFKLETFLTLANQYVTKHHIHRDNIDNNFRILNNLTNEDVE